MALHLDFEATNPLKAGDRIISGAIEALFEFRIDFYNVLLPVWGPKTDQELPKAAQELPTSWPRDVQEPAKKGSGTRVEDAQELKSVQRPPQSENETKVSITEPIWGRFIR